MSGVAGDDRTTAGGGRAGDGPPAGSGHWRPMRVTASDSAGASPAGAPASAGALADGDRAAPSPAVPGADGGGSGGIASSDGRQRDRPRRRRGGAVVVVLLVLVLAVGGACAGAELYVRFRVASTVRSAMPGLSSDARVATEGLVLPQVLRGKLDSLSVTAGELELASKGGADGQDADAGPDGSARGGLRLLDADASLTSVGLSDPFPAGRVDATASVGWDQVATMVAAAAPNMSAVTVQAGSAGSDDAPGTVSASAGVLGLAASLTIVPSITDDGGLLLDVTSVTVRGVELDTDATVFGRPVLSYVGLDTHEIRIGADSLPQGLNLTRVSVTDKGLRLTLSGSDVELADL